MNAYDKIYLEKVRVSIGRMIDYAIYDMHYDIVAFWESFVSSPVSKSIEDGDASMLAGRSGVEMALMVANKDNEYVKPTYTWERSPEYWLGWAIAYYQWSTGQPFSQITEYVSIVEILSMYTPYHEMDIRQFCDKLGEVIRERKEKTNLKKIRISVGISQSQLAEETGIPIRTIQQYEQGQKNINKASAEYIFALARALYCEPKRLLE